MNEKPKILVVDDRDENLFAMRRMLKEVDAELIEASSGPEALSHTLNHEFAAILMDVQMPEMNGFETTEMIRENEETAAVPVIFVTAIDRDDTYASKGYESGAVDFLFKPIDKMILVSKVNVFLDLYKNQKKVESQSKALVNANRIQQELVHILCHDLVNPLGAITTIIDVMEDEPEEIGEMLPDMKAMAQNGLQVIDLVRAMMAIEEKGLDTVPTSVKNCLDMSYRTLKGRLSEKNMTLELPEVDESLKVEAESASLVNSVFNNLITNAIKFSPEGGKITISVKSEGDHVTISIRDYGIGMPESIRRNLFDVSKKTSRAGTGGESGTGFGMPLVQKFMKAYGGHIDVETQDVEDFPNDSGTTMILEFNKA